MSVTDAAAYHTNRDLFLNNQVDRQDNKKKEVMGKDAFLTMMVAQLKNQDPLNPLDGTDFTAQLAQFSGLEQQIQGNSNLESILGVLGNTKDESNIFDYIGKVVESDGNPVQVAAGEPVSGGSFTLKESASITVTVYNKEHVPVRQMGPSEEFMSQGTHNISWDGTDENGQKVPDGEYTYEIIAKNGKGHYVPVSTKDSGMVDGVTTVNGAAYLSVGGRLISPASVEHVRLAGSEEEGKA